MGVAGLAKGIGHAVVAPLEIGAGGHMVSSLAKGAGIYGAMAAVGAGVGAATTLSTDGNVNPVGGAVVGATVGAAALPVAGIGIGLAGRGAVTGFNGLSAGASAIGSVAAPIATIGAGVGLTMGSHAASAFWGVGKRLVRWDESASELKHVKISGIKSGMVDGWKNSKGVGKFKNAAIGSVVNGTTLLGGAAIAEGVSGAWNKLVTAKMGTMTGVQTLTPQIPNYSQSSDDSGATGDLVFALHKNRRG